MAAVEEAVLMEEGVVKKAVTEGVVDIAEEGVLEEAVEE